jgi:hypothetical protein
MHIKDDKEREKEKMDLPTFLRLLMGFLTLMKTPLIICLICCSVGQFFMIRECIKLMNKQNQLIVQLEKLQKYCVHKPEAKQ